MMVYQPERSCVGCFKKFPQKDLLSVRKQKNGIVVFDPEQKKGGRSVYLCKNENCFLRATKRKGKNALAYGLKVEIPAEVLVALENFFKK